MPDATELPRGHTARAHTAALHTAAEQHTMMTAGQQAGADPTAGGQAVTMMYCGFGSNDMRSGATKEMACR